MFFREFLLLGSYGSRTSGRKIHTVLYLNKLSESIGDKIVRGLLKDKIINDNYSLRKTVNKKENCAKPKVAELLLSFAVSHRIENVKAINNSLKFYKGRSNSESENTDWKREM